MQQSAGGNRWHVAFGHCDDNRRQGRSEQRYFQDQGLLLPFTIARFGEVCREAGVKEA